MYIPNADTEDFNVEHLAEKQNTGILLGTNRISAFLRH